MYSRLLFIAIIICTLFCYSNAQFRGGTISWVKYTGGKVRFTYRLTWKRGTGPCGRGCSFQSINKRGAITSNLSSLEWNCTHGCTGNVTLNDVNYIMTSVSNDTDGSEQGEHLFFYDFIGTGPFEITLDKIPWTTLGSGSGRLIVNVNLGRRNDTGLPNASPIAAVPPYLGIPFGCRYNISLPAEDPDADRIKCRLANPSECGGACTTLPNIVYLNEDTCTINIEATSSNGYQSGKDYRVAVMVEDYPDSAIDLGNTTYTYTQALSKIPLQFTVWTVATYSGCQTSQTEFALPTVNDGTRISYPGKLVVGVYKTGFYLESPQNQTENFIVSVPARMTHSVLPDDFGRSNITRLHAIWDPTSDQMGDAFYCTWGLDSKGITSGKRCVTSMIVDYDECTTFPCKNNATCINLFHRYKCVCQHGFKGKNCSKRTTCSDIPCKNNGTCLSTPLSYRCSCQKGFSGLNCERDINECKSNPCFHGATCKNMIGGFKCLCLPGFIGITCSKKKVQLNNSSSSISSTISSIQTSPYFWPIVAGIGCVLLLLIVGLCCCIYFVICGRNGKRNQSRRTIRTQSIVPSDRWADRRI